jgi:hypothetical protein
MMIAIQYAFLEIKPMKSVNSLLRKTRKGRKRIKKNTN